MCTKIVSGKDPLQRIKPCIAPGLPAEAGKPGGNNYSIGHNP